MRVRAVADGADLGQQVVGIVRPELHRVQINGAVGTVEQIRLPVELGVASGESLELRGPLQRRLDLGVRFRLFCPANDGVAHVLCGLVVALHQFCFLRDQPDGNLHRLVGFCGFVFLPNPVPVGQPAGLLRPDELARKVLLEALGVTHVRQGVNLGQLNSVAIRCALIQEIGWVFVGIPVVGERLAPPVLARFPLVLYGRVAVPRTLPYESQSVVANGQAALEAALGHVAVHLVADGTDGEFE